MRVSIRSASILFLLILGLAPAAHAGDAQAKDKAAAWHGNAQISGKVTDEAGKGVADAKVTFVFAPANEGFFATTKKNGEFSAKDLKPGEWRVQVDAPNFVTIRQTVTVADGKNAPLSLQLKRDNSPELLTKADALFKEGKNAEARAEYMKVLEAHPDLAGINRAIAFTYGREGNHPEALKYLDLAIANNPDDATLLQLAAASAIKVSDFPRAMGYLDKIDDSALADSRPLTDAAINMIQAHQPANAVKLLNRSIARFPAEPEPYFYRGFARLQLNQTDTADAKADLQKFVDTAPPTAQELPQAKELLARLK
jgi:tetratricopeptide (TPR) repeat protein